MLDQSFSAENFYSILVYENRKGNNLEKKFFRDNVFEKYSLKLKEILILSFCVEIVKSTVLTWQ